MSIPERHRGGPAGGERRGAPSCAILMNLVIDIAIIIIIIISCIIIISSIIMAIIIMVTITIISIIISSVILLAERRGVPSCAILMN